MDVIFLYCFIVVKAAPSWTLILRRDSEFFGPGAVFLFLLILCSSSSMNFFRGCLMIFLKGGVLDGTNLYEEI
jgi:hypothetical protein